MEKLSEDSLAESADVIDFKEALITTSALLSQSATGSTYQVDLIPPKSLLFSIHSLLSPSKDILSANIEKTVRILVKQDRPLDGYGLLQFWMDVHKVDLASQQLSELISTWAQLDDFVTLMLKQEYEYAANDDNSLRSPSLLIPLSPLESPPPMVKSDSERTPTDIQTSADNNEQVNTMQRPGTIESHRPTTPYSTAAMSIRGVKTTGDEQQQPPNLRQWKARTSSPVPPSPFETSMPRAPTPHSAAYQSIFHSMHFEKNRKGTLGRQRKESSQNKEKTLSRNGSEENGPLGLSRKRVLEKHKSREVGMNSLKLSTVIEMSPVKQTPVDDLQEKQGMKRVESMDSVASSDSDNNEDFKVEIPKVNASSNPQHSLFNKFLKVAQSQHQILSYEAYMSSSKQLFKRGDLENALLTILEMPDGLWTLDVVKFMLYMYVIKKPKDLSSARKLLEKYVPESPSDSYLLWFYYTSLVRDAKWTECVSRYEEARENSMPYMHAYLDNAIMEVSLTYGEYEFGWQVHEKMKEIDKHTPAIVITICWKGFFAEDKKFEWEARAWAVYGRMQSTNAKTAITEKYVLNRLSEIVKESPQRDSRDAKITRINELLNKL